MNRAPAVIETRTEPQTAPAVSPGTIAVDITRDLDLRQDDVAALDRLTAGRPHAGVFVSRAWLSGFFAEPPAGFAPSIALLRDGRALCGMVPLAVCESAGRVHVRLLGGGIGSDRVDLLAVRGREADCADTLVSWLGQAFGRRAVVLELRDVPADSPLWGAITRANGAGVRRLALQPREVHPLPYLDLTEAASRLAGGVPAVKSFEKHRRWLERRGRLRIETLQEPGDALAAFESLTAFLHARWRSHLAGSTLDEPRLHRFHRHVIPLLLAEGRLRMIRLSSDMRTIAVFYGLAAGTWRGYYLAGYDREWAGRIHLGQLTLAAAIDLASREGATEFDFLKGAERVKYLWQVRERASLDADVYSAHAASQFSRAAQATREAAGAFVKSARHLVSAVRQL